MDSLDKIIKKRKNKDNFKDKFIKGQKYNLGLEFITPTRIKYKGKYTDIIDFKIFITNLLRRLFLLNVLFCIDRNKNYQSDFKSFKCLIDEAKEISTQDSNLKWYDFERYSTRQNTKMKLGGIVGKINFTGYYETFLKFYPLILLGEHLHIGKGTSFGLGGYKVLDFKNI